MYNVNCYDIMYNVNRYDMYNVNCYDIMYNVKNCYDIMYNVNCYDIMYNVKIAMTSCIM